MGNTLIFLGLLLVAAGLLVTFMPHLKVPLLPGDILIKKEGFTLYIPIVSSILLSLLLTFLFGGFRK
jgi:hypothetical protein